MHNNHLLRRLAALALLGAGAAVAQPAPRSYAVISELARDVSVVAFQEATGTRVNPNQRQRIPVPDGALDKVALLAAQKALKQGAPDAGIWLLAPADSDFFDGLQSVAAGDSVRIPDDLAAALKQNRSTHLLLFTRHRSIANFRFLNVTDGDWPLDGLGFYVERRTTVRNVDTGEVGRGYLAPFAHFRATLVDANSGKVVKTETARTSHVLTAGQARDGSGNPWEALTPAEKMNALRDMLQAEVARLVPVLVTTP